MSDRAELQQPSAAVQRVLSLLPRLSSPECVQQSLEFRPRATDVILTSGTKSGSTWMQQIIHALRSNGDMSFGEIMDAVPVFDTAYDAGINLDDEQKFFPRMYRTHLTYGECPQGAGKYIVVTRDSIDAAVSQYHYVKNWLFDEDEISVDEYVTWAVARYTGSSGITTSATPQMDHQATWYPHRKDPNVVWLHYEDMKHDLTKCIKLVSDFLEIGVDDAELLKLVEEQASLEFMKKHSAKFDAHPYKIKRNEALGLPKFAGVVEKHGKATAKVREGQVNAGKKQLAPEVVELVTAKWKAVVGAVTGYDSYQEMRAGINREFDRSFD